MSNIAVIDCECSIGNPAVLNVCTRPRVIRGLEIVHLKKEHPWNQAENPSVGGGDSQPEMRWCIHRARAPPTTWIKWSFSYQSMLLLLYYIKKAGGVDCRYPSPDKTLTKFFKSNNQWLKHYVGLIHSNSVGGWFLFPTALLGGSRSTSFLRKLMYKNWIA